MKKLFLILAFAALIAFSILAYGQVIGGGGGEVITPGGGISAGDDIVPATSNAYDIGSATSWWKEAWITTLNVSGATINVGTSVLSEATINDWNTPATLNLSNILATGNVMGDQDAAGNASLILGNDYGTAIIQASATQDYGDSGPAIILIGTNFASAPDAGAIRLTTADVTGGGNIGSSYILLGDGDGDGGMVLYPDMHLLDCKIGSGSGLTITNVIDVYATTLHAGTSVLSSASINTWNTPARGLSANMLIDATMSADLITDGKVIYSGSDTSALALVGGTSNAYSDSSYIVLAPANSADSPGYIQIIIPDVGGGGAVTAHAIRLGDADGDNFTYYPDSQYIDFDSGIAPVSFSNVNTISVTGTNANGVSIIASGDMQVGTSKVTSASINTWNGGGGGAGEQTPWTNNIDIAEFHLFTTNITGDITLFTNSIYARGFNPTSSWEIINGNKLTTLY